MEFGIFYQDSTSHALLVVSDDGLEPHFHGEMPSSSPSQHSVVGADGGDDGDGIGRTDSVATMVFALDTDSLTTTSPSSHV